ncbi:hypothetical protein ACS0TY_014712 [Phlomoides rotata]
MEMLNSLWIGSYKLRVFVPKYERNRIKVSPHPPAQTFRSDASIRSPERSYKEVIIAKEVMGTAKEKALVFNMVDDEKAWLENCWTTFLRKEFAWEENGEEIQWECGEIVKLCYMGDNVICIKNGSKWNLQQFVKEMGDWVNHWFEWVRNWQTSDVCHRRLVWTRWFGVPLHAWNPRFFRLAGLEIGNLIKVDDATEKRDIFDFARVLLSVPYRTDINRIVSANIDGQIFQIKVAEETLFDVNHMVNYESEDSSLWSSEDFGSILSGPTIASVHGRSQALSDDGQEFVSNAYRKNLEKKDLLENENHLMRNSFQILGKVDDQIDTTVEKEHSPKESYGEQGTHEEIKEPDAGHEMMREETEQRYSKGLLNISNGSGPVVNLKPNPSPDRVLLYTGTKKEKIDEFLGRSVWGNNQFEWAFREAEGRSGGILSIWNSEIFSIVSYWNMKGAIVVNGLWGPERTDCCIVNMYAPCPLQDRIELWDRIQSIVIQNPASCVCV